MSIASDLYALGALMKTNLEAKGVTGLTGNEGLTTLAGKILEIPSGPDVLSLSVDKSVVSYYDSESAVATVSLVNANNQALANKNITITVVHGSTTIDTDTVTTDSNGEATYTYTSAGIGDITISAAYGMLLQERYVVEDCIAYYTKDNNPFSDVTVSGDYYTVSSNKPIISLDTPLSLPSSFEITYTGNTSQQSNGWNLLMIGASANCNQYNTGMLNNKGGFLRTGRDGCTFAYLIQQANIYNYGDDVSVVYQYDNGVHKLIIDGNEYSVTNSSYSMSYFFGIGIGMNSKMKNIKIKTL